MQVVLSFLFCAFIYIYIYIYIYPRNITVFMKVTMWHLRRWNVAPVVTGFHILLLNLCCETDLMSVTGS